MALAPCNNKDCEFCKGQPQNKKPGVIIMDGGSPRCPYRGKLPIYVMPTQEKKMADIIDFAKAKEEKQIEDGVVATFDLLDEGIVIYEDGNSVVKFTGESIAVEDADGFHQLSLEEIGKFAIAKFAEEKAYLQELFAEFDDEEEGE